MRFAPLLSLVLILVVAGCAAPASTTEPGDNTEPGDDLNKGSSLAEYQRDVTPFTVYDEDGTAYDHPFLGGLSAPRVQFVDINNNGRLDLFVQEENNRLMFFENVEEGEHGEGLVWRTDTFHDIEVGEWFRFVEAQEEGLYDLLSESPYSYIRYHRNVGTPEEPVFEVAADTLRDVDGEPIFSDRQNIPNMADIECDGLPDLFLGKLDGTITRFTAEAYDEQGVPQFELVTERFGDIQIIGEFGEPGSTGIAHGANSMTFADYNGNGVIDLFFGDFFEPGLLLIENSGRCGAPNFYTDPQSFPPDNPVTTSGYNAPDMVDWTGNGQLDLFVGVLGGAHDPNTTLVDNFLFYEAQAPGDYELRTTRFLYGIDVGNESAVAAGDLTGNGLQDLLVSNKIEPHERRTSGVYFFENTGTATEPEFQRRGRIELPETHHYAPALGDITGDGEPDLIAGTWRGGLRVFRNTGIGEDGLPTFEEEEDLQMELPRGGNSTPTIIDIENDGLLDVVSGASDGTVHFFRNEGSPDAPTFTLVEDYFENVKVTRRSAPVFLDLDDTGTPDLYLGTQDGELVRFANTGTPGDPSFEDEGEALAVKVPRYATPVFVDLHDAGYPVLISGGRGGGLMYFAP